MFGITTALPGLNILEVEIGIQPNYFGCRRLPLAMYGLEDHLDMFGSIMVQPGLSIPLWDLQLYEEFL